MVRLGRDEISREGIIRPGIDHPAGYSITGETLFRDTGIIISRSKSSCFAAQD